HLAHRRARSRARAHPPHAPADALEPEGSRADSWNQLQGAPVQDHGRRPRQSATAMNLNHSPTSTIRSHSRVLAPTAFKFVLNRELRRAMRSSTRLSLVVIETTRSLDGVTVTADERTVGEVAQL